jgi:IS30 family transposase
MRYKFLTDDARERIAELHAAQVHFEDIASMTGYSKTTIWRLTRPARERVKPAYAGRNSIRAVARKLGLGA